MSYEACLRQPRLKVLVAKAAYQVKSAFAAPNTNGREFNPVEGMGFDHGVMHHVQED